MNNNFFNGLSFIIPAFNEQNSIALTLQSINSGELPVPYEVIVVDHSSSDSTAAIAEEYGAKVIRKKGGTIASVRNIGVKNSHGKTIVFLDADVSLTPQWFQFIGGVIEYLNCNRLVATGSFCSIPVEANWIERFWFDNLAHNKEANYLGTGHMIVRRELFELNGGFDESLSTGEDYSFCAATLKNGGHIINNPDLRVIHRDYPKNIKDFITREAWHGSGDVSSIKNIMASKVAIAAFFFLLLHISALMLLIVPAAPTNLIIFPVSAVAGLLLFSAQKKFGDCSFHIVLVNSIIYYFYFTGRSISFMNRCFHIRQMS